jgi:hypothetical protein
MSSRKCFLGLAFCLALVSTGRAQVRPYIGFVYPAGGQQGTTFRAKLGGQGLDDVNQVIITGAGVTGKIVEYNRVLGAQEITLVNEQLRALKRATSNAASTKSSAEPAMMMAEMQVMSSSAPPGTNASGTTLSAGDNARLIARLEKRVGETVNRPASVALASIVYVEVTIAPDAEPGQRELRLATLRGVSNPLVFHVGQLPEVSRKAMVTAPLQVLGKEEQALRKRPAGEVEERVTIPCTVNGQVASGERNRYRFAARKGQNLVITTQARQLIPFIADAVPGWFQPVLALHDSKGKEVAYDDDFRFKPDPTILWQVPEDGEYALEVYDAIYRGREDFVYRITIGEVPFVTSRFPLGSQVGARAAIKIKGWNLAASEVPPPAGNSEPGICRLTTIKDGYVSNPMPFALDTLPETVDKEPNNAIAKAQKVTLPVVVNGRIEQPGDWDVFQFTARSNDTMVAEVDARRLDSPLDSVLKLTDATGKLVGFNDDREDLAAGINTHHADAYLMVTLPADGTYYVHLGDTARNGGEEYGYRLSLSAPQPDFALRVVPSSASMRSKGTATLNVHVIRKDGFTGPIKLTLKDPPPGFSANPVFLVGTQTVARLNLKTDLVATKEPVTISIVGSAKIQDKDVSREAVPAEDRMQAFLWRHLVPASDLRVLVYDPAYQPAAKRAAPPRPPAATNAVAEVNTEVASTNAPARKPQFTKQQVAGRLRQLKLLYEDGLLTDDFYDEKVAECELVR